MYKTLGVANIHCEGFYDNEGVLRCCRELPLCWLINSTVGSAICWRYKITQLRGWVFTGERNSARCKYSCTGEFLHQQILLFFLDKHKDWVILHLKQHFSAKTHLILWTHLFWWSRLFSVDFPKNDILWGEFRCGGFQNVYIYLHKKINVYSL